ncbi:hypothetical protein, partial [Kribbella antibiotica]|uniref:hypothetical protein n=1 Tax=Kribbella antibiotica TaxID=190195 RepID=UPI001EDF4238
VLLVGGGVLEEGGGLEDSPDGLQPTNRPAPAISSPRRPNSPEETMTAVSPATQMTAQTTTA